MSFKSWLQRAKLHTWLLGNNDVLEALKKAYEAGQRSGRKDAEVIAAQAMRLRDLMHKLAESTTSENR